MYHGDFKTLQHFFKNVKVKTYFKTQNHSPKTWNKRGGGILDIELKDKTKDI